MPPQCGTVGIHPILNNEKLICLLCRPCSTQQLYAALAPVTEGYTEPVEEVHWRHIARYATGGGWAGREGLALAGGEGDTLV